MSVPAPVHFCIRRWWLSALLAWSVVVSEAVAVTDVVTQSGFVVRTWSIQDGLPDATVNAIAQTPDGYLWVGTLGGLARFDGTRFTVFNARNTPALGSGRIKSLYCNRKGCLLIGTVEGGLVRYERDRFTSEPAMPPRTLGRALLNILEDDRGALWFSLANGGVTRLADGRYSEVSPEWGEGDFHVRADSAGRFWAVRQTEVFRLVAGKPVLALTVPEGECHAPNRSGGYWVSTGGEVRLWKDGQWIAKAGNVQWSSRMLLHGIEDSAGHLWLASRGQGLFRYETNGTVLQFTAADGLGSDFVLQMFEDREGNLWAGTDRGGLSCLRPSLFRVYGKAQGLPSDRVCSVAVSRHELWVATDGDGLSRLQPGPKPVIKSLPEFSQIHMGGLAVDHTGQLWIGTQEAGLFKFSKEAVGKIAGLPDERLPAYSLLADEAGRVWLGQRGSAALTVLSLDEGTPSAERIVFPPEVGRVDVRAITLAADDTLWLGTDGSGLLRLKERQWQRFGKTNGLGSDTIWALHADASGGLWIGTFGGGLSRLKDGRIATCTTREGLTDDAICSIADDGQGQLWFGSHRGVFSVKKRELEDFFDGRTRWVHSIVFGPSDGLPSWECVGGFQSSSCRTADGRLWFATIKGVVEVNPAELVLNTVPPAVYVEDVVVDGESMRGANEGFVLTGGGGSAATNSVLRIAPGRRRVEFRYTGMSFSAPESVRFQTWLEGLDDGWVEAGAARTASYGRLVPGRYEFRVRACNRSGVWNEAGASVQFELVPYFWQAAWFQVASIGGFAGGLGGTVWLMARRRARHRIKHLEHLHAVEQERARISRDIHDELGTVLTGISLLSDRSQAHCNEPEQVVQHLRKIGESARGAVQSVDGIVWAINPQNDTLDHLANYLVQFAEGFFHLTNLRCRLDIPMDLPNFPLGTQQRHHVLMAVKEACNNVVRHAGASEVWVRMGLADGGFWVAIEDNGRGFLPGPVAEGCDGLRNLRQRLAEIGGRMELTSTPGQGTRVRFCAPLGNLSLSA
jgi:signal transduction histidine kinase/ligand-binding sensor domain-containing protein